MRVLARVLRLSVFLMSVHGSVHGKDKRSVSFLFLVSRIARLHSRVGRRHGEIKVQSRCRSASGRAEPVNLNPGDCLSIIYDWRQFVQSRVSRFLLDVGFIGRRFRTALPSAFPSPFRIPRATAARASKIQGKIIESRISRIISRLRARSLRANRTRAASMADAAIYCKLNRGRGISI